MLQNVLFDCLQMAKVTHLVWGDSHMRRVAQAEYQENYLGRYSSDFAVEFKYRGGAKASFLQENPSHYVDTILVALGSNDLDSGIQPGPLFDYMMTQSQRLINEGWTKRVIILNI